MVSNLTVPVGATSTNILPVQKFSKKRQQVILSNVSAHDIHVSFAAAATHESGILLKSLSSISINANDDAGLICEEINAITNGSSVVLSVTVVE